MFKLFCKSNSRKDSEELKKEKPKLSFAGKWAPREGKSYNDKMNLKYRII